MFQVSEKSEASIWFSLYEPATINIIGGNLHFLCTNSGSIVESPWHVGIFLLEVVVVFGSEPQKDIMEQKSWQRFFYLGSKSTNLTVSHHLYEISNYSIIAWCKFEMYATFFCQWHKPEIRWLHMQTMTTILKGKKLTCGFVCIWRKTSKQVWIQCSHKSCLFRYLNMIIF